MCIWVRSQKCGCFVTWFCYQMIAKPGNKTAPSSWPDPFICDTFEIYHILVSIIHIYKYFVWECYWKCNRLQYCCYRQTFTLIVEPLLILELQYGFWKPHGSFSVILTGARFTNVFLPAIQIRWKLCLAVIPLLAIRSQQFFAHATTAQLSCHVQNFVAITLLDWKWEWNKISLKFDGKTISETGPWSTKIKKKQHPQPETHVRQNI